MTSGILLSIYLRVKSSNGNVLDYENKKWDPNVREEDESYIANNEDDESYLGRADLLTQLSNNALSHTTNPYVENHSQSLGVFGNKFGASPAFGNGFLGVGVSTNDSVSQQFRRQNTNHNTRGYQGTKNSSLLEEDDEYALATSQQSNDE